MPSPAQTHRALSYFMASFAQNLDRQRAAQASLTTLMDFSEPGGGVWTLRVANGICHVSEDREGHVDLMISQSPETFVKTRTGIEHPMLALWTGKIKVHGWRKLGVFEKLFPIQSLDFAPAPVEMLNLKTTIENHLFVQTNAA